MNEDVRQDALFCGLTGFLMLGYAFFQPLSPVFDHGAAYARSFDVFRLTLLGGGTLLLVVASLSAAGIGIAAIMEAAVTSLSGILMTACAICWTVYERGIDFTNLMVLVFGLFMARSGIRGLASYVGRPSRRSVGGAPGRPASGRLFGAGDPVPSQPAAPEPVHPASLSSSALPKDGEAAPDEGYLAALSKEQDESPQDRDA